MYGATIGKLGIAKKEMTSNQACCACTPFSFIYHKYLFYYLLAIKPQLIKQGFGGAQPNISKDKITNNYISFPCYKEQVKICDKLDEIFKKISILKDDKGSLNNLINLCKHKILDYYFGENSCYKSYYPSVPLKNICTLEKYNNTNNGNLPYLEAKVIRGTKTAIIKDIGVFVSKGTRIILVDGENSGEIMIVPCDGYMGSTFRVLNSNDSLIDKEYLSFFILYNKKALKDNKTGSAIPHLNKKIFNSLNVILPPLDIQQEFARKIFKLFDIINKIS